MHETRSSSFSNTIAAVGQNERMMNPPNKQSYHYDVTFVFVCLWHCVLRMLISWVKCPRGSWISPPSRMNRAEWLWNFTHDHLKLPRIQVCPCSYSQGLGSIVLMITLDVHLTLISWIQASLLEKNTTFDQISRISLTYLCWFRILVVSTRCKHLSTKSCWKGPSICHWTESPTFSHPIKPPHLEDVFHRTFPSVEHSTSGLKMDQFTDTTYLLFLQSSFWFSTKANVFLSVLMDGLRRAETVGNYFGFSLR